MALRSRRFQPGTSRLTRVYSLNVTSTVGRITVVVIRVAVGGLLGRCNTRSICKRSVPVTYSKVIVGIGRLCFSIVVNLSRNDRPVRDFGCNTGRCGQMGRSCHLTVAINTVMSVMSFLLFRVFPQRVLNLFNDKDGRCFSFNMGCFQIFLLFA